MHTLLLVGVAVGTTAGGDLLEQEVDDGATRKSDGGEWRPADLAVRRRIVQRAAYLHSSSFFPSARRARNRWLRTAGSVLPVTLAISA